MNQQPSDSAITRLHVRDFKSIRELDVELKPLTVVVGKNSAGKSSLIQSLLLVVQHFTNEHSTEKQISLNQHLVRLGAFSQVRRRGAESTSDQTIGIEVATPRMSWAVDLCEDNERPDANYSLVKNLRGSITSRVNGGTVTVEIQNVRQLQESLPYCSRDSDGSRWTHRLRGKSQYGEPDRRSILQGDVHVKIDSDLVFQADFFSTAPGARYPNALQKQDFLTFASRSLVNAIYSRRGIVTDRAELGVISSLVNKGKSVNQDRIKEYVTRIFQQVFGDRDRDVDGLIRGTESLSDDEMSVVDRQLNRWLEEIHDVVAQRSNNDREWARLLEVCDAYEVGFEGSIRQAGLSVLQMAIPGGFERLIDGVLAAPDLAGKRNYVNLRDLDYLVGDLRNLAAGVFYIGPIRDLEFPADPIPNAIYVGRRGEQTIEVLQRESKREIIDPSTRKARRFSDALRDLLHRFELAEDAKVEDRGRERAGLSVQPFGTDSSNDSDEADEVNNVGVGVSQLLPILVQCLLAAPENSTVIIEQPELHLHPRLEQELADFFLECVNSGRRLIIETHSEHLVNRLRRRIAEDGSNQVADAVKILFAEKVDGVTEFREPTINKYGLLEDDWPEGFLDLSAREAKILLDEARERRVRELEERKRYLESQFGTRSDSQK